MSLLERVGRRVLQHGGGDVYATADSGPLLAAVDVCLIVFGDGGAATHALTPKLTATFAQLKAQGYRVALFFAGDITADWFPSVWAGMSWPAVQEKAYAALKADFEPTALPALYLLDRGGDVIEPDAHALANGVTAKGAAALSPYLSMFPKHDTGAADGKEAAPNANGNGNENSNGNGNGAPHSPVASAAAVDGADAKHTQTLQVTAAAAADDDADDAKFDAAPASSKAAAPASVKSGSVERFNFQAEQMNATDALFFEPKPKPPRTKRPAVRPATASLDACVSECREEVARVVAACRLAGTKYTDPDFGPEPSSLWMDVRPGAEPGPSAANDAMVRPAQWRRATDVAGANARLVDDAMELADVAEGGVGTRYLLSAIAALVCGPKKAAVENVFVAYDVEAGVYGLRFFLDSEWYYIVVDDWLPCDSTGALCYARNTDNTQMWMPVVEKAYAKLHGSYEAISFGSEIEALQDLSGGVVETLATAHVQAAAASLERQRAKAAAKANAADQKADTKSADDGDGDGDGDDADDPAPVDADGNPIDRADFLRAQQKSLFVELRDRLAAGSAFCVSPTALPGSAFAGADAATLERCGLLHGHGYGVLGCQTYRPAASADSKQTDAVTGAEVDLIQLRNPWERLSWTGAWSEGSKEWRDEAVAAISGASDDGAFWMGADDFFRHFPSIHSCFIFDGDWSMVTTWAPVPVDNPATPATGVSFAIRTPVQTHVMICVEQDNIRSKTSGQIIDYVQAIGFNVLTTDAYDPDPATAGDGKSPTPLVAPTPRTDAAALAAAKLFYTSHVGNVRGVNSWVTLSADKTYVLVPFFVNGAPPGAALPPAIDPNSVVPRQSLDMHIRVYTKVAIYIIEHSALAADLDDAAPQPHQSPSQAQAQAQSLPLPQSPAHTGTAPGAAVTPAPNASASASASASAAGASVGSSPDATTASAGGGKQRKHRVSPPAQVVGDGDDGDDDDGDLSVSMGDRNSPAPLPVKRNPLVPSLAFGSLGGGPAVGTAMAAPAAAVAASKAAAVDGSPAFGAAAPTITGLAAPQPVRAAASVPAASAADRRDNASPVFASSPPQNAERLAAALGAMSLDAKTAAVGTRSGLQQLFGAYRLCDRNGPVGVERLQTADLALVVFGMAGCRHTAALLPGVLAAVSAASDPRVALVFVPDNFASDADVQRELSVAAPRTALCISTSSDTQALQRRFGVVGFPTVLVLDRTAAVVESDASEALRTDPRATYDALRQSKALDASDG